MKTTAKRTIFAMLFISIVLLSTIYTKVIEKINVNIVNLKITFQIVFGVVNKLSPFFNRENLLCIRIKLGANYCYR